MPTRSEGPSVDGTGRLGKKWVVVVSSDDNKISVVSERVKSKHSLGSRVNIQSLRRGLIRREAHLSL